jgi:hypothetical protein
MARIPVFPVLSELPNPGNIDPDYIRARVTATYAEKSIPPYEPSAADLDYWVRKGTTYDIYSDNVERIGWNDYWEFRILADGTPFEVGASGDAGTLGTGVAFKYPSGAIVAQLGLLEDDILYRLSLLCVNVLQPLKDKYPGIVIIGGFRRMNTGVGQHELGEAVDLQIRNQTPQLIYEVADYIQKSLNFDQLILNWTNVGDQQPWIHVSFSPTSLRELVQTKDFADVFHTGLYYVTTLTGEDAAQALRENAAALALITSDLRIAQARQAKLAPKTATEVTESGVNTGDSGSDNGGGSAFEPPNESATIQVIFASKAWIFDQGDEFDRTNPMGRGAFTEECVRVLHGKDPNWGHIRKNPGQNQYNGHAVDFIQYKRDDLAAAVGVDIASSGPTWGPTEGFINKWYY